MGVGPAMASTSPEGEVRKTPVIQRAALGYISIKGLRINIT